MITTLIMLWKKWRKKHHHNFDTILFYNVIEMKTMNKIEKELIVEALDFYVLWQESIKRNFKKIENGFLYEGKIKYAEVFKYQEHKDLLNKMKG